MTTDLASQNEAGPPPKRLRIVLAEDHQVVRRGLQLVLDGEPDFEVVAQAGDVSAARRQVRELHPDVLLLDLNMPGAPSLEAIPKLRAEAPDTRIVVLTIEEEPELAREALRAGALSYVLKEVADDELALAIRRAAAGERYLNRRLAALIWADQVRNSSWN